MHTASRSSEQGELTTKPDLLQARRLVRAVAEGQDAVCKSADGVDAEQQDGNQRRLQVTPTNITLDASDNAGIPGY